MRSAPTDYKRSTKACCLCIDRRRRRSTFMFLGAALRAGTRLLRMYGPPRDCKGKFGREDKSAQMYSSIRTKALSTAKTSCSLPEVTLSESGFRDQARAEPHRITFGGTFSINHQYGHQQQP
jgi:hypothetical protein